MLPVYEIRNSELTVKRNSYELVFPEHMHEYIEIVYTYKGVQHLKIEGSEYTLKKGCLSIIFPDTLHSFFSMEKSGKSDKKEHSAPDCEVLVLMCSPKLFGNLFPDLKNLSTEYPLIPAEYINGGFKAALDCIDPSDSFEVRFSWACVILSYVIEALDLKRRDAQPVNDITYKIMKYVEENFTEPITRKSLAEKFSVSEGYISKIFTRKFKMNFRNYLGLMRAEYAANLIRTTDESFITVSNLAGFESPRTFNRMFKAAYGTTPREYKNNINKLIKEE